LVIIRLFRASHFLSSVALIALVTTGASAQSKPSAGDRSNPQRGRINQPQSQPPINVTVTTPQPSPEDAQRERNQRAREVASQEDIRDFTRALTILTIVQAGITLGALWVSIRAANAAKKSADVAERTMIETQRAFVLQDSIQPIGIFEPDARDLRRHVVTGFVIQASVKNSGNTPAVNCVMSAQKVRVPYHELDANVSHGEPPTLVGANGSSGASLGPGIISKSAMIPITNEELDGLLNRTLAIYLHMSIQYRDFFAGTPVRHTKWCARVLLNHDPRVHNENAFSYRGGSVDHNTAT
jgi:hypothetical protein